MSNLASILLGIIAALLIFLVELAALFPPILIVFVYSPSFGVLTMLGVTSVVGGVLALVGAIVGHGSTRKGGRNFCLIVFGLACVRLIIVGGII